MKVYTHSMGQIDLNIWITLFYNNIIKIFT